MASLKIGAVPHSDERYIAKLQFFQIEIHWYKDNFFQWKLWYCFFQIWNPGGLQEAFRSCILVWSFDFLSKNAEKTTNIAHLKIGGYTHFDGRYVTKPKFFSKQDRGIIFFQWKLRCCFFQIWYLGGIQEASRSSILIWNFEIFQNFQKNTKFSNQNRASGSLLEAS